MDIKPEENNYAQLLYIAFGSLLGVFVTIITDFFRKKIQASKFKKVVFIELEDLQMRLAIIHYLIGTERGLFKLEDIKWFYNIISEYDGPVIDTTLKEEFLRNLESTTREVVAKMIKPKKVGSDYKKHYLPTLESGLQNLANLKPETSRAFINVLCQLNQFNEIVDRYNFYFDKTLETGISTDVLRVSSKNLSIAEESLYSFSKRIVDDIDSNF